MSIGIVLRGRDAAFDTLSWEAYREGYDDARYLQRCRTNWSMPKIRQARCARARDIEVA